MVFAHIPIKLTTKNGMRTLQKINPHFSYIRFTFQQKIAYILFCLNGDDEQRYMHSIQSNQIHKKSHKNFS